MSFFYRELITPAQQLNWYSAFLNVENDLMYIVEAEGVEIGCMGVRDRDNGWDIYNVILGDQSFQGKGYMSQALRLLCTQAIRVKPQRISAKVLNDNPALGWYYRNCFKASKSFPEYTEIELKESNFVLCDLREARMDSMDK
jgi:RimJ/RimL family protein N-acetyltransferase